MKKIFTFLALTLTFATTAQDIIPDDTFGTDGFFTFENPNTEAGNAATTIQADGKIIVVDQRNTTNRANELFIARLNTDGTPDLNFANNGFFTDVQFEFTPEDYQVFLFEDDIIVITQVGDVIRLNTDGELVTSFGDNGVFTLDGNQRGREFILLNNIIYSIGFNSLNSLNIETEETNSQDLDIPNELNGVSEGANGQLYIETINFQTREVLITAIDTDGNVNTSFGNNGTIRIHQFTDLEELEESFGIFCLDSIGNLYAAVFIDDSTEFTTLIRKFDANGNIVTNFGDAGTVTLPDTIIGDSDILENQLYIAGAELLTNINQEELQINLSVTSLNIVTGDLNTTFNNTGNFVFNSNANQEFAANIHVLSNDSFITSGGFSNGINANFVARFIDSNLLSTNDTALPTNSIRFKNPITTQILTFSSASDIDNISLYNVLGRKVAFNKNAKEINTSTLSNGTYFARLTLKDKQIITKKVIINR